MNDPLKLQNVYCVKAITMQSAETLFFFFTKSESLRLFSTSFHSNQRWMISEVHGVGDIYVSHRRAAGPR